MNIGIKTAALAGATLLAATGFAYADSAMEAMVGGKDILVDQDGMTLYTFDKDSDGTSACYGGCAANWPPLMAASGAMAKGDYSLVTRKDGSKQWAYKGMPLYLWKGDSKKGDMTGDGFKGVWHVARP